MLFRFEAFIHNTAHNFIEVTATVFRLRPKSELGVRVVELS